MSEASVSALRVVVPEQQEDALLCQLWELGTLGVEHLAGTAAECALLAYFRGAPPGAALRAELPDARIEPADVPDVDWVARFRDGFRAFAAGGFRIRPAWQQADPADVRCLIVDPGRAFGTGSHESTRLCLSALEEMAAGRPLGRVVDVGSGTGLLAIAALRLGATSAVAIDVDPDAVHAAARHALLNDVRLGLVLGDGGRPLAAGCADTVLANLTAQLLLERSTELGALLGGGGRLVLSGLLRADAPAVAAAYARLGSITRRHDGDWAALRVDRP